MCSHRVILKDEFTNSDILSLLNNNLDVGIADRKYVSAYVCVAMILHKTLSNMLD